MVPVLRVSRLINVGRSIWRTCNPLLHRKFGKLFGSRNVHDGEKEGQCKM